MKFALFNSVLAVVLALATITPDTAEAEHQYLSESEVAAVVAGTAATLGLAFLVKKIDSTHKSFMPGPLPLEGKIQSLLGGRCDLGQRNFLDNTAGSAITPIGGAILVASADLYRGHANRRRAAVQDLFLFTTGLAATKGVTDIAKRLVARERPLPCLHPALASERTAPSYSYDHQSFFSGHTSAAFFSMTFLNLRLRSIMRRELTQDEYRDWSWAPPTLLFGWASVVGWSRIHAYKHYLTDVIAGALAGYYMAKLFYSFGDNEKADRIAEGESSGAAMIVRINFKF